MKKIFLRTLISSTALCVAASASAYHFEADGLYFDTVKNADRQVEVTFKDKKYNSYTGALVIPATVTHDGKTYTVVGLGKYSIRNSAGVTSVQLPEGLQYIGMGAFSKCNGLTQVTVPNSVTKLDNFAFNDCPNLSSVTLGTGLETIGASCFYGDIKLPAITIPAGVKTVDTWAFRNCFILKSINIPANVTKVGNGCFEGCLKLESITVDAANATYMAADGILYNKAGTQLLCYPGGKPGDTYTIPGTIKEVGFKAFASAQNLKKIICSEGVETLGNSAFDSDSLLTEFVFAPTVTKVGNGTFAGCIRLPKITLADAVTLIDQRAFADCAALKYLYISTGCEKVAKNAFTGCTNLSRIEVNRSTPPEYGATAFPAAIQPTAELVVPIGAKAAYQQAEGWKEFANISESHLSVSTVDEGTNVVFNFAGDVLRIEGAEGMPVSIYDISGRRIAKVKSYSGEALPTASGINIVTVAGKAYKVIQK